MYPFFETIRYVNGVLENVSYHQARINRTVSALGGERSIQLDKTQIEGKFEKDIVYKIKCLYNLEGAYHIEKAVYHKKTIQTVSIHQAALEEYQYKYTNRNWLNDALKNAGTDEMIIVQNNMIKDGNYANLAFFNGSEWHTPLHPLLLGTHRARLIEENKIIEKDITLSDLANYTILKYINAMMLWEESPEIEIGHLVHS
jgi:4-amino-4-deoxychorismate lyase